MSSPEELAETIRQERGGGDEIDSRVIFNALITDAGAERLKKYLQERGISCFPPYQSVYPNVFVQLIVSTDKKYADMLIDSSGCSVPKEIDAFKFIPR